MPPNPGLLAEGGLATKTRVGGFGTQRASACTLYWGEPHTDSQSLGMCKSRRWGGRGDCGGR